MLGFSIYLNQEVNEDIENYIKDMKQHNFTGIFTSLHIPEDDVSSYKDRITKLAKMTKQLNMELTVDVDEKSLKNIGYSYDDVSEIKEFGITGIRVDFGLTNEEIANLSKQIKVALNASTIVESDVSDLQKNHANFDNLEAWHNYYPRPETGLSFSWYVEKNTMLKANGFKTMGFVPGDEVLRGPLMKGLPTLEKHRYENPLACAVELFSKTNTDMVYVGDSQLSSNQQRRFNNYFNEDILELKVEYQADIPSCLTKMVHSRKDLSEDVIRIEEGRFNIDGDVKPENQEERSIGSITIDNTNYGRYMGEIQIVKHNLSQDSKVNVIGEVIKEDISLLEFIKPGQQIVLNRN